MRLFSSKSLNLVLAGCAAFSASACSDKGDPEVPLPVIVGFTASKGTAMRGETVTLSWEVTGAVSLSISDDAQHVLVAPSDGLTGTVESRPLEETTTFTLTAVASDGEAAVKSATVRVGELAEIVRFSATPNPALLGHSTVLAWEISGATSLEIRAGSRVFYTAPADAVATGTTASPLLTTTSTTFTLVASSGPGDVQTAMVTVTTGAPPVIRMFRVRPRVFTETSTTVEIRWMVENAASLALTADGAEVPISGTSTGDGMLTVTATKTTVYALTASGVGIDVRAEQTAARAMSEVEPNDEDLAATPLTTGAGSGTITADDVDFFSIIVPQGGSIFAETSDGHGGCALDTILRLYDATGRQLGANDDIPAGGSGNGGGNGNGGGGGQGSVCSRIDPRQAPFAANLTGGTYYLSVEGPQATDVGPYVLYAVASAPSCGNAILEGAEQCDEGPGSTSGLCTPMCTRIASAMLMPPGGRVNLEIPPLSSRVVTVLLTHDGQSIAARVSDAAEACTVESRLTLRYDDYQPIDSRTSDVNSAECAAFTFPAFDYNTDLPRGTYFLEVENETLLPASILLEVQVHDAVCGDGARQPSQGEQCDDSNAASGDGCSSTCMYEALGTVTGPPGDMTFMGSIDPAAQADQYRVTLTSPGYITAETFLPIAGTCTATAGDTVLEIFTSDFRRQIDRQDQSGPMPCEHIAPRGGGDLLPAGSYWVTVRSFGGRNPIASYAVHITLTGPACGNGFLEPGETCDDGNMADGDSCPASCQFAGTFSRESEPNNALDATANASGAALGAPALFLGSIDPARDVDTYAVEISGQPAGLRAVTHTNPSDVEVCEGIDTRIAVFDAQGNQLASDDDGGAETCSRITPTTAPQVAALAPGRYYVQVRHYNDTGTIPVYFLTIAVE